MVISEGGPRRERVNWRYAVKRQVKCHVLCLLRCLSFWCAWECHLYVLCPSAWSLDNRRHMESTMYIYIYISRRPWMMSGWSAMHTLPVPARCPGNENNLCSLTEPVSRSRANKARHGAVAGGRRRRGPRPISARGENEAPRLASTTAGSPAFIHALLHRLSQPGSRPEALQLRCFTGWSGLVDVPRLAPGAQKGPVCCDCVDCFFSSSSKTARRALQQPS